jgi:hypothetical protein
MNTSSQSPIIINTRQERAPIPLDAPDIAVAFHDQDNFGLIPVSELSSNLIMDFKVWDAARPGFTYRLVWDGELTGTEKIIEDTDVPGNPLTLEIPVTLLIEGKHTAGYRVFNPATEYENFSDPFPVVIDKTEPGKPELSAIHFPVEVQNGLTAAELAQLGDQVDAHVAGYTGMAKHDLIRSMWGNIEGPVAVVNEDDMGLNKVVLRFSGDFLRAVPLGVQAVTYEVVDRAGNISKPSIPVDIQLLLEQLPENYPAPILDPAIGDVIEYSEARTGVRIDIPHYPGAQAFDQITLFWGADKPMLPVQLPPESEGEDIVLSVRVPYETIALIPLGTISISYEVARQNQLTGSSLSTEAEVFLTLPIAEPAFAPVVQGTSLNNPDKTDNFIDEDDYEFNARAIVKWDPQFRVNDDINLFWGEQSRLQWYQIKEEDISAGRDLIIPVANSIMKAQGTGAEIPVRYAVVRAGNPNAVMSTTQPITVRSKEELPGGAEGIDGPAFKLTAAGLISLTVAANGTDGHIVPYANIAENQKLFFTFRGFDESNNPVEAANFTATRELDDIDVVNGYSFHVPFNTLRTVCAGYCEAYVRVEPAPGSNQSAVTSKLTRVPIDMRETIETTCTIRFD